MTFGLPPGVEQMVALALQEDLGNGDVTTRLTVSPGQTTRGRVVAKQRLVVSGGDVFQLVMARVDPSTRVAIEVTEGDEADAGEVLMAVEGEAASLLMAERVALNFLQRLCGVATLTRAFVSQLSPSAGTRVTDTRKTSPGMRFLERRAVVHGGGYNHRADLGGGILIKENHITHAGSITRAVKACLKGGPHPLKVAVEVTNEAELEEAIAAGAHSVLLDNMAPDAITRAVTLINGRVVTEVSGGVSLDNIADYAGLGVDVISIGQLTHSAPAADISFLIEGA
jgi:nicotinate-nucleotide pyrophosphorylase (carboxylating)